MALIFYEKGDQMATTNVIRAEYKKQARETIRKRYMKNPGVEEVIVNIETDIMQLD
jgi:hypothetical protein